MQEEQYNQSLACIEENRRQIKNWNNRYRVQKA